MTIGGASALWLLVALLVGTVQLFFGYRLVRLVIVLLGAIVGFSLGPDLIELVIAARPAQELAFLAALAAALLFGALAWLAFGVAVFIWGASVGFALAQAAGVGDYVVLLVVAVVAGALVAWLRRPLIIALTALHGAFLVVGTVAIGLGYVAAPATPYYSIPDAALDPILLGASFVLAIIGAAYQFRSRARPIEA